MAVEKKVKHIKLGSPVMFKQRGLILNEKVGTKDERPKTLETFLRAARTEQVARVAGQIVWQVCQLGDLLPNNLPRKKLLWCAHDIGVLKDQWERCGGAELQRQMEVESNPIELFTELMSSDDKI